jgi:hypothetical protein
MNDDSAASAAASCTISCRIASCDDTRVSSSAEIGVGVLPIQLLVEAGLQIQRGGQRGRGRCDLALVLAKSLDIGGELVFGRQPGRVGRIQLGQVPFELFRNLRAIPALCATLDRQRHQHHQRAQRPARGLVENVHALILARVGRHIRDRKRTASASVQGIVDV